MNTQQLLGLRVFVSPDLPKMKLTEACPVTPDFRAEMDAWLLSFFGTINVIADGQVMKTPHALHMNPRTWAKVRSAMETAR